MVQPYPPRFALGLGVVLMTVLVLVAMSVTPLARAAAPPALTASVVGETPSGGGVMRFPQAVAVDPRTGQIFVGDQYGGAVQVYNSDGSFRYIIGAHATRLEPGRMGVIGGVAVDRSGHLYVLDAENNRVQIFATADGSYLGGFGDKTVFDLLGGVRVDRGITAGGIAVWQAGVGTAPQLYVADDQHNRVLEYTLDPVALTVVGSPRTAQPDQPLRLPQGLAVHPDGTRLYVADNQHHQVVEFSTSTLKQIGHVGTQGSGPGQFQAPYDVSVDNRKPNQLYVADNLNGQVDVFDAGTLAYVGTFGGGGHGVGTFSIVRSVAALTATKGGGVVVADTANNRIQVLDGVGNVTNAWGIPGRGAGYVSRARGAVFTPDGGIAIADTFDNRVALMAPDGTFVGQHGKVNQYTGFATAGSSTGQFLLPQAAAFDSSGNLWVADSNNSRMVQVDPAGNVVYTSPDGEVAKPRDVATGPAGTVFVADSGHGKVVQLAADGSSTTVRSGLNDPMGVAAAPDGTPYVSTGRRILNAVDGSAIAPPPDDGAYWDGPGGLAFGPDGTLYVSELRRATPNGTRVLRGTPAGPGTYSWDTIATEGAGPGQVIDPANISVSADGRSVLVADAGNNRILRFDAPGVSLPVTQRLDVTIAGGLTLGSVSSDPDGIHCATDCMQHFGTGRVVTLTAAPRTGSIFSGWTGACASAGLARTCTVTMDSSQTAGATFGAIPPPPVRISGLLLTPSHWTLSRRADRKHHRRARLSTRAHMAIRLTQPAAVTVAVQVPRPGQKTAAGCVPLVGGQRAKKGQTCTRYATQAGVRRLQLIAGRTSVTMTPHVARRTLKPGVYRLVVVATDAVGNVATRFTRTFVLRK